VDDSTGSAPSATTAPEHVTARGNLNVAGVNVDFEMTVPTASASPRVVLPVLQMLSAAVQARAAVDVERAGKRISCGPHCAACCRQLVPISAIEARRLVELIENLPNSRRVAVLARFAEVVRRLAEAGLLASLRHPKNMSQTERSSLGTDYFRLRIPCPFLEDESCSIYPDRPLICREYLVTSPAENCANPKLDNIEGVPLPVRVSRLLPDFGDAPGTVPTEWIPLVLAPEWVESHPDQAVARPAPEWLTLLFQRLAGQQPSSPDQT
jgi:Fe-S-cluster containining protein